VDYHPQSRGIQVGQSARVTGLIRSGVGIRPHQLVILAQIHEHFRFWPTLASMDPKTVLWTARVFHGECLPDGASAHYSRPESVCPLSPLLYNLVPESLLEFLCTYLAGLAFSSFTLRTLAYADDRLVTVRDQADLETFEREK
jgi:hypothetical protein